MCHCFCMSEPNQLPGRPCLTQASPRWRRPIVKATIAFNSYCVCSHDKSYISIWIVNAFRSLENSVNSCKTWKRDILYLNFHSRRNPKTKCLLFLCSHFPIISTLLGQGVRLPKMGEIKSKQLVNISDNSIADICWYMQPTILWTMWMLLNKSSGYNLIFAFS